MKGSTNRAKARLAKAMRGTTSLAVLLALLLGMAPAMALEPRAEAEGPFAEMRGECLSTNAARMAEAQSRSISDEEIRNSPVLMESMGLADRYIVKFREDRAESFKQKLGTRLEAAFELSGAAMDPESGKFGLVACVA